MSDEISKFERESHMRIFEETVNKEQFEGIHIHGQFEEPALIMCIDRFPNKAGQNILKNTINFSNDNDLFIYLYLNGSKKGYKFGKIEENIEQIYLLEEILSRYNLKMIEVKDGKQRFVKSSDFITTLKL